MKILKTSIISLVSCFILAACGTESNLLGTSSDGKISAFSLEQDENAIDLANMNKSIDLATSTKNTVNNINLKFYYGGSQGFPAIYDLIKNAKESIYIEMFIFHNDYTGKKIAELLSQKAKQGLEVRVLYDYVGNSNVSLMTSMAKSGVVVQAFNQALVSKSGVNITHRKVFVADGVRGMTGGMNIGEKYEYEWDDTMAGFEGEAVKYMLKEFMADWRLAGGKTTTLMQTHLNTPFVAPEESKKYTVRVAVTSPREQGKRTGIKNMMIAAIDSAKKNIKVAMPYFSDDDFINHLIAARQRGVKVTALMPLKSDQKLFDIMGTVSTNQLVQANVEVFRTGWKDNSFSHSKVMTIDDQWATVGSCNADARAFNDNQELNIAVSDPEYAQRINKAFFDTQIQKSAKGEFKKVSGITKKLYSFVEELDFLI